MAGASTVETTISPEARHASALALQGVVKTYPGVRALRGVDFECRSGEIHALLGENGAGKSTLVNVASGNLVPDEGTVHIGGRPLPSPHPRHARELGLAIAYQDDSLIPDLTVADNMLLSAPRELRPPRAQLASWAREQLGRFATEIDPATPVRELPIAARQIVEIAKALVTRPTVLVLDEPTAALTASEAGRLHELLADIATQGTGVVYITHRLPEVLAIADRISVLRDGEMVATATTGAGVDEDRLVELMVGKSVDTTFPSKADPAALGEPLVELHDATGEHFTGVSLGIRAGEIVGFAGVEGNGQRETLRALAGLGSRDGRLLVGGRPVAPGSVSRARAAGITFVSGDRRGEAVFTALSVRDNLTAGALPSLERAGVVTRRHERDEIRARLDRLALRTASVEHSVASLSGGNQQKIAIGRAVLESPSVYLIEEPTQGVDAGTRLEIYRILREEAGRGAAVVVVSSDALELAGLCDRVLVFSRGHVVEELCVDAGEEEQIVGASARAEVTRSRATEDEQPPNRALLFLRRSDLAPVGLLAVAIVAMALFVAASQPEFLSSGNISNLLFLAVPLGFAALGQAAVMMTGGIDLSIGPVISLTTVAIASITTLEHEAASTTLAIAVALALGLAVGLVNAVLVRKLKLQPLIATLATFIAVQGFALLWMATPGGEVGTGFATAAGQLVGVLPVAFVALVGIAVLAEVVYRRRIPGLAYRAVGSRPAAARRLGIASETVHYAAYALGGVCGAIAGVFFVATIQIGDPALGVSFTLASVTAVVLGGMSTWGGRGSLVGAVAGAVLLAVIANGARFLDYGPEVQYYVQGCLLIGSIALYSRVRATGRMRDETLGER